MEGRQQKTEQPYKEELDENEIFRSLGSDYSCVFHVNLRENRIRVCRLNSYINERSGDMLRSRTDYRQLMLNYVLSRIEKPEQERVIQSFLPERLMLQLQNQSVVSLQCHERHHGKRICHSVKAARYGNSPYEAVIGIVFGIEDQEGRVGRAVGQHMVLAADPDENIRKQIAQILGRDFAVIGAGSAGEIQAAFKEYGDSFSLMLADEGLLSDYLRVKASVKKAMFEPEKLPVMLLADEEISGDLPEGVVDYLLRNERPEIMKSRITGRIQLQDYEGMLNSLEKDPLTGLYTKEFFYRYANDVIRSHPDKRYRVVCTNIENFRMLNEKYGTTVGDLVLTYGANQVKNRIPGVLVCGRLGGDIFAALREDLPFDNREELLQAIRRDAPVPNLTVKFGIAATDRKTPVQVLCDHAQTAISKIKHVYGVDFASYDDAMRLEMLKEQDILDGMEQALEKHQFEVCYQPKHLTATGRPGGAEALVRWIHPEYGYMNPAQFIPMFEKIGFIRGLDRYVWVQVCRDIARWKAEGLPLVPISINVSRRDFETGDLADWILNLTGSMGIEPELIHLEITETTFADNPQQVSDCVRRLHGEGFQIELDDFGAGYSSLTTLNSMDLDVIKMDKSIIQQDRVGAERNVLEFCMQLAKMMKLKTVAEGVETEAQCRRAQSLGCDYIQGYYYSRPISAKLFERYLRRYAEAEENE